MATFNHPCPIMICGGSGSGKSELTRKIISNHQFTFNGLKPKPKVLWLCGVHFDQKSIKNVQQIVYREGMVTEDQLREEKADLVVIDDLCNELSNDRMLQNIFTKYSHHMNFSVFYISQSERAMHSHQELTLYYSDAFSWR